MLESSQQGKTKNKETTTTTKEKLASVIITHCSILLNFFSEIIVQVKE